LWESFPEPLKVFLQEVHAGFMSGSYGTYGIERPLHMQTMAQRLDLPCALAQFDEWSDIPAAHLVEFSRDSGKTSFCLSPDTPGEVVTVYPGSIYRYNFWDKLDNHLMANLGYLTHIKPHC
jgi:hypothetical protein